MLNEPTVVAVGLSPAGCCLAGSAADAGRTPVGVDVIRPLKDGVISDYQTTEKMLKHCLISRSADFQFGGRAVACVLLVTEVENRRLATPANGGRKARAIRGAGCRRRRSTFQPSGAQIDIGGGTADIAVISFSGVVVHIGKNGRRQV